MWVAAARNSFERTQFFDNTGGRITPSRAVDHCRARSESLAEPRPEYGHSRVAVAVFGPRNWTESLCLDRRGFLISYHYEYDTENADSLRGLIHGALPVVANIGLDYFFSAVDSHGFGSGSKLPLNISALVGVVSGSRGDLRVGLAHQMVEIHEPVRPLAIVHARKEALHGIIHEHGRLSRLTQGGWLRVMVFDPSDKQFYALERGAWARVAFEKESLTQLYRWGMLNKLDVGGPLSGGNSLMRWSSKPRRRSTQRASATRSADKGRDGIQI